MTKKFIISAAIVVVVAVVISFAVGMHVGQKSMLPGMEIQLDSTQAMLAYNQLDDDRKVQLLLSKGCVTQAQSRLDFYEDRETRLLSEFFKGKLNSWAIMYITDRDPQLVTSLGTFKSKYGSRWDEPDCK